MCTFFYAEMNTVKVLYNKVEDNAMDKSKNDNKENGEDATKYGEFVSSYFGWITLDEQKQIAKKLDNITKKDE